MAGSDAGLCAIVLPTSAREAVATSLAELLGTGAGGPASHLILAGPRGTPGEPEHPQLSARVILAEAQRQIREYLAGSRRALTLPVDLRHGSAFQRRVWRAVLGIPYGRVQSYKWVAGRVGGAAYARAVGHALGANPLPILVPCHRVVAHDATLGGFTGGLPMKRRLLELEGVLPQLNNRRRSTKDH